MFTDEELITLYSCVHFTRHTAEQDFVDDKDQDALRKKLYRSIDRAPEWLEHAHKELM